MGTPRTVYVALFALTASVGVVFALLKDLQDEVGFGTGTLGVIAAMSFFAAVAAQLTLAPLADRGHARALMVGATLAAALASFWFAAASTAIELIAARVLAGAAFGAFAPAVRALVTADPATAGRRLGVVAAIETAGFISGPGIGAVIVDQTNIDMPFILLGLVTLAVVPRLATMPLPEVHAPTSESFVAVATRLLRQREGAAAVLLGAAFVLPAGMYEAIWSRFMGDLGASTLFIGVSLTLYGVPFALTAPIAGRFIDAYGPWRMMTVGFLVVIPLTVVYGHLTRPGALMSLAMFEAVGNAVGIPATQAVMARVTRDGERAAGQGLVAAGGQIGAGVAALAAGPLYASSGPEVTFAAVALAIGLMAVIGFYVGMTSSARSSAQTARQSHPGT